MLPQSYLSVSQVQKYLSCPRAYFHKYFEGLEERKSGSLAVGVSFHHTLENFNRRKRDTGETLASEELEETFEKSWDQQTPEVEWKDEDPAEEKQRGLLLAKAYIEEFGEQLKPQGIEADFEIEIVSGIPFRGVIDIIEEDGSIRDFKTARKTPPKDQADKSLQLTAYAAAFRTLIGCKEKAASLDYAISLKTGPKILRLETEITEARIDRLRDTVYQVANAIEQEIFPRNEGVNCKNCSFRDYCLGE